MKALFATVLLSCLCMPVFAHMDKEGEHESRRWLKVSVDGPFALFGAFLAKAEFKLGQRLSLLTNVAYVDTRYSIKPTINSFEFGNDGLAGVKFGIGARWYLKGGCMDGVYFEDILDTDIAWTRSGNAVSYGPAIVGPVIWIVFNTFHIGYSWVTDIGFFVDAAMGINVQAPLAGLPTDVIKFSFYPTTESEGMNRFEARLALGWAF